jgi:hypothetical protein
MGLHNGKYLSAVVYHVPAKTSAPSHFHFTFLVDHRVAHSLSDHADMPIESMRIDLTDLVVSSLRSMPEHKALVTNWTAILKAIDGAGSKQSWRNKEERRKEGAKKRVLLRMLASAVEMEVNADSEFGFAGSVDPDMLSARKSAQLGGQQPSKKQKTGSSQEDLTLALVKALPGLFVSYKEETTVLQSLTTLPRYFRTYSNNYLWDDLLHSHLILTAFLLLWLSLLQFPAYSIFQVERRTLTRSFLLSPKYFFSRRTVRFSRIVDSPLLLSHKRNMRAAGRPCSS